MYMIGLDCQFDYRPSVFLRYLLYDLFQTVMHRPYRHLFPPFRTEKDVIENVVYRMLLMNILLIQVDKYSR